MNRICLRCAFILFTFSPPLSERVLLNESPGGHTPRIFSHANRVVKKFPSGVFLIQATGVGRVSRNIIG